MSEETMAGREEDFYLGEKSLTCDNCDKEFLLEDGVEYDTHNSCNECIKKAENECK